MAGVLRAHNPLVRSINECFTNRLVINCISDGPAGTRHCLPTFGVVAMRDRWVDRYSSGVSIPANQQRHAHGSHRSVVKPMSRDDDAYSWVRLRVADCLEHKSRCGSGRQYLPKPDSYDPDALTTEALDRLRKDLPPGYRFYLRPRDWGS